VVLYRLSAHAAAAAKYDRIDLGWIIEIQREPPDAELVEELRHHELDQGIPDMPHRACVPDAPADERRHHVVECVRAQQRPWGHAAMAGAGGDP
jgi:hypothetical protein